MFKPVVDKGELVTFHLKRCSKHIESDHNAGDDGNDDEGFDDFNHLHRKQ